MSGTEQQAEVDIPSVAALNRIADALERLADAYLYCSAPDEEGDPQHEGQSLSDIPRGSGMGMDQ